MQFKVRLKQVANGNWYARCVGSIAGTIEKEDPAKDQALQRMREEIRYRLEYCPCSGVTDEFIEMVVEEGSNGRG